MEQFGGSPFLMHHQVLGEPFAEWMTWLDDFTAAIDANWQDIRRWWGYLRSAGLAAFRHPHT